MKLLRTASAITLTSCLLHTTHGSRLAGITKRAPPTSSDIIKKAVGGVLYKNGLQTSCEFLPFDNRAAFIAASCLNYDSNGKVETSSTDYQLLFDNNVLAAYTQHPVEKIHIHPSYDTKTFANNIAVIEFNTNASKSWTMQIAMDSQSWDSVTFVRRSVRPKMNPNNQPWWNNPVVMTPDPTASDCSNSSAIYSANTKDFVCGNVLTGQAYNKSCTVPYGSVYANVGNDIVLAGVFSHSAVYGSDICTASHQASYFTLFSSYVMFANSVLNRTLATFIKDPAFVANTDAAYKMNSTSPSSTTIANVTVFSGDIYPREGVIQTPLNFNTTLISGPVSTTTPIDSSASVMYTPSPSSPTASVVAVPAVPVETSKLSRSQVIIIATVVPIASIIVIVAFFVVYRWRKHRKQLVAGWDARSEFPILDTQPLAQNPRHVPSMPPLPAYEDLHFEDAPVSLPDKAHI
ncbi:hypothetical protein GQ54DRAFT_298202 [Martensiomyces pterosporus]|nr:hypothetical protein GQ54DRAFT_298202 [Martensiomyces pterosporus]